MISQRILRYNLSILQCGQKSAASLRDNRTKLYQKPPVAFDILMIFQREIIIVFKFMYLKNKIVAQLLPSFLLDFLPNILFVLINI